MTMLSINTNIGALNSSQSSYAVNKSMEASMERLSSGKRINSGADDAAGADAAPAEAAGNEPSGSAAESEKE